MQGPKRTEDIERDIEEGKENIEKLESDLEDSRRADELEEEAKELRKDDDDND